MIFRNGHTAYLLEASGGSGVTLIETKEFIESRVYLNYSEISIRKLK